MRIKRIEIERLRCVLNDTLECEGLTALVGKNGAGKSCFLHALRLFYAVNPVATDEDFYNRQTGEPIKIRVTFTELLPQEADAFRPYLDGHDLIVTKKITIGDGKVIAKTYGASRQHPEFARVRSIDGRAAQKEAFNELVSGGGMAGLIRATSATDAEEKMLAWEALNPGLCVPIEKERQFLGPEAIGVGWLDSFTKFVFIPAVRDAADETGDGKNSALAALLDLVVNERVHARPDLQALRDHVREQYAAIFAPGNQPELGTLAQEISEVLGAFHPGAAVELGWRAASPPELSLPSVDPTLTEDGFRGHVSRKGHGLQRALVLSLLQARAQTLRVTPTPTAGEPPPPEAQAAAPRRRLILVVEEPELYQHPQQCRHWAKVLRKITTVSADQPAPDTQVIFTTHSPHFVDLSWFDQVRVIRKLPGSGGAPPVAKNRRTTLNAIAQELAIATGRPADDFTAQGVRARARPVMTTLVNEGFFANVVVLVEGGTEIGLLHEIARRRNKDWDAKGIAVIDVGGKTKLDKPLVVFRRMGIPTYVVFDADAQNRNLGNAADQRKRADQNRLLLKLLGVAEADYPTEGARAQYAVVGEETGRHLRATLGEANFNRFADSVATELGYDGPNDAMKNVDAAALFVSRVYDDGKTLPLFEAIVECATALAPHLAPA